MSVLNPTLSRLYTPPTCTLEVTAKASPLSRWTRTPTLRSLQFSLSFDSLAQRARETVEIYGDQTQLLALSETVTLYIQTVLASRPADLPLANVSDAAVDSLERASTDTAVLALRPRTLLTHELLLGSLATEQSGPSLLLKVSQLYDLATALEDCSADLQQIPSLMAAERPAVMPLLRSAAAVLLAVGLGTATWRLFQTGPIAVSPSTSTSDTAMAPAAPPPTQQTLPAPAATPSSVLRLPTVELPTRSANPSNLSGSVQEKLSRAEPSAANKPSRRSPTAQAPSLPSIASLPSAEVSPPNLESGQQADRAAPSANAQRQAFARGADAEAAASAPQKLAQQQSTLFDTIPQVAEVRDYVASRWQPTSLPPKTLEYRVTLNADGSLNRVEPLGAAAQQYLAQVPLPTAAAGFVSPTASGARPSIRLLLRQDGTVQTFLDTAGQ